LFILRFSIDAANFERLKFLFEIMKERGAILSNKLHDLSDAISKFVHSGDHIATGGFTTSRKPMAAMNEIIRQGQTDFIVEAGPAGSDWDMLIGAGRVKAYINCYTANPRFSNVSRRFRAAIEEGKLLFEDYSQDAAMMMFHGAALGLTHVPVRMMLGSGMEKEWGISAEQRRQIDKLPNEKFVIQDDPFHPGEKLLLLPTPRLDTAMIHVQMAHRTELAVFMATRIRTLIWRLLPAIPLLPARSWSATNIFGGNRTETRFRASRWRRWYMFRMAHTLRRFTGCMTTIRNSTSTMTGRAIRKTLSGTFWKNGYMEQRAMRTISINWAWPV